MANYGIMTRDAKDYRGRPRWPWVVLILLVLAGGVWLYLKRPSASVPGEEAPPEGDPETASEVVATPAPPLSDEHRARLDEAFRLADDDALVEARDALLALLDNPGAAAARKQIEERLGEISIELLTTPRPMPGKVEYAIAAGDQIRSIARKHGMTIELVCKANQLRNPDVIQVGDRLRLLDNPAFAIVVRKGANDLLLTMDGKFVKRYTVSTGKYGRTPVGTFKITVKAVEPIWYIDGRQIPYGDKENILGTRWMAIEATGDTMPASGYGIHGTWEPESLGRQSSAGCIRMSNSDVEELYLIVPEGTPVTIQE
ncbi:MAG: L,D-transpeptidase family protein [Kiritimatiellia bacterium]|jgi:LysM repeat protein